MGIISSKKKAIDSGSEESIYSSDANLDDLRFSSSDYREIDKSEIRDEGKVGVISDYKDSVSKYQDKQRQRNEASIYSSDANLDDSRYSSGDYGENKSSKKSGLKAKAKEVYEHSISPHIPRPLETLEEKDERLSRERERATERATVGMTAKTKKSYVSKKYESLRKQAEHKAERDHPVGESVGERKTRLEAERSAERKVRQAYRESRAKAAGTAAGKPPKQQKEKKGQRQGERTVAPSNPMMGMGGLVPHGFLPPEQGSGAPGFTGYSGSGSPGFRPNMNLRPVGFEAPQAPSQVQERPMSRREMHRQQVNEMTRKAVVEHYQQPMYNPFLPQAPPQRDGRNEPYHQPRENRPQSEMYNPFKLPERTNKKGSNGQSEQFYNPFEHSIIPQHDSKSDSHSELAKASASLLGLDSFGTNNSKGNKKSKRGVAPWEM